MKSLLSLSIVLLMTFSGRALSRHYIINESKQQYTDTNLAKYLDTNLIVYNETGKPLKYHQYLPLVLSGQYQIWCKNKKLCFVKLYPGLGRVETDSVLGISKNMLSYLGKKSTISPAWERSLIKNMPKGIDTNVVIYDQNNRPYKFYQYFGILFNWTPYLQLEKGGKYFIRMADRWYVDQFSFFIPHTRVDTLKRLEEVYNQLLKADNILVIKSQRKVYLQRAHKTFLVMPCQLGANPVGDKHQDGDRRTPEGWYTIVSRADIGKYGKSLQISYPDSSHIAAAKQRGVLPGKDVMIHGTSAAKSKSKDWTNGCIALSNAHIDSMFKYVMPGTSIEIRK